MNVNSNYLDRSQNCWYPLQTDAFLKAAWASLPWGAVCTLQNERLRFVIKCSQKSHPIVIDFHLQWW